MDLEDLFSGKHRHKHTRERGPNGYPKHHDWHDDSDDSDDGHRRHQTYSHGEMRRRSWRHQGSGSGSDDGLRSMAHLLGGMRHLKWIVAAVLLGGILLLLLGGLLLAAFLPIIAKSLGLVADTGIRNALESAVPSTGLKGAFDSAVAFLQTLWNGKGA